MVQEHYGAKIYVFDNNDQWKMYNDTMKFLEDNGTEDSFNWDATFDKIDLEMSIKWAPDFQVPQKIINELSHAYIEIVFTTPHKIN